VESNGDVLRPHSPGGGLKGGKVNDEINGLREGNAFPF
jgi:hypothetical protein